MTQQQDRVQAERLGAKERRQREIVTEAAQTHDMLDLLQIPRRPPPSENDQAEWLTLPERVELLLDPIIRYVERAAQEIEDGWTGSARIKLLRLAVSLSPTDEQTRPQGENDG